MSIVHTTKMGVFESTVPGQIIRRTMDLMQNLNHECRWLKIKYNADRYIQSKIQQLFIS